MSVCCAPSPAFASRTPEIALAPLAGGKAQENGERGVEAQATPTLVPKAAVAPEPLKPESLRAEEEDEDEDDDDDDQPFLTPESSVSSIESDDELIEEAFAGL